MTSPPSARLAFAVVLLAHTAFLLVFGIRHGGDTMSYSAAADALIATGFDFLAVGQSVRTDYPVGFYALFASLVALLKLVFGEAWMPALVALNLLATAGTAALLVAIMRRALPGALAGWIALLLYLGCYPIAMWSSYALSDATFMFLAFGVFALAANRLSTGRGRWWPVFAAAALTAFYRPTGLVLVPATAWAWLVGRYRAGALLLLGGAAAVAAVFLFAGLMARPDAWPIALGERAVAETAIRYGQGELVHGRPDMNRPPPQGYGGLLLLSLDRTVHFFAVSAPAFSPRNRLASHLLYLPLYLFALVLLGAILSSRDGLPPASRRLFLAAAGTVAATALFHGLLQVDHDWRYRLPILPHLILLASGGAALVARRLWRRG